MTLDTNIYVQDRADHREVFAKCNQLIGATEQTRCKDTQDETWAKGDGWKIRPDSPWTIMNEPDQGLPGWLMLNYRPGAPLVTETQAQAHDEDCEPDCTGEYHEAACWLRISLDTAYSYSDGLGGCGDLHARFVAALGKWLDEKGIRWSWQNEFTGEIHQGAEGLDDLGKSGADARNWMMGTVLPAIRGRIGA